jgi:hypothetical protein
MAQEEEKKPEETAQDSGDEQEQKDENKTEESPLSGVNRPEYKPEKGPYQVLVHIIEARDLKGRGLGGMSDPVVTAECLGLKKTSSIKNSSLNCVWDEILVLQFPELEPDQIESEKLFLAVYDANTIRRDVLIGSYEIDLSFVYYSQDHEIYRKWLALTDVSDEHEGIQGYLKVSVAVLGANDELKIHKDSEEDEEEGMTVLVPPHVEQKGMLLNVQIYDVQDLPQMDDVVLMGSKCDPYLQVEFAGINSVSKTVKGQSVSFNQELQLPVMEPAMSDHIKITIWDNDVGLKPDRIAVTQASYSKAKLESNPRWINFYGAPEGFKSNKVAKKMNKNLMEGSFYRGRALIGMNVKQVDQPKASVVDISKSDPSQVPRTTEWILQVDCYEAMEIPKDGGWAIEIAVGTNVFQSSEASAKNGSAQWYSSIINSKKEKNLSFVMPEDSSQIPDLFIYLVRKKHMKEYRLSYLRIPFKEALKQHGWKSRPKWFILKEDKALDKLDESQFPGIVLLGLRVGLASSVPAEVAPEARPLGRENVYRERSLSPTRADIKTLEDEKTGLEIVPPAVEELKSGLGSCIVTVRAGKELPIADRTSSDPYVVVSFQDQKFKTSIKKETLNPVWEESKQFSDIPNDAEFLIEVFDYDFGSKDDLLGKTRLNLRALAEKTPNKDYCWESWLLIGSEASRNARVCVKVDFKYLTREKAEVALKKKAEVEAAKAEKAAKDPLKKLFNIVPSSAKSRGESFERPVFNQYQVRAHIYQCRDLMSLDSSGLSDPFLIVRCAGECSQTVVKEQTVNPIYYATKLLNVSLPEPLEYAPDIVVSVFDKDIIGKSEFLGRFSVPVKLAREMNMSLEQLDPQWFDLFDVDNQKIQGQVLASFQVIPIELSNIPLPSLKPKSHLMFLEICSLGLRSLSSVLGINKPRIEFELPNGKRFITDPSRVPSPRNPNFLQVLKIPVRVPVDRRFAPSLNVEVRDTLFGGFIKRQLGTSSILLEKYMEGDDSGEWQNDTKMEVLDEFQLEKQIEALLNAFDPNSSLQKLQSIPSIPRFEQPPTSIAPVEDELEEALVDEKVPLLLDLVSDAFDGAIVCHWDEKIPQSEDDQPKFRRNREIVDDELEDYMRIKPFDEIGIYTGKQNSKSFRKVGLFKGVFRLSNKRDSTGSVDTKSLLSPQHVFIRLYILRGKSFTPMDSDNSSDPYLNVRLGKWTASTRDRKKNNTVNPEFYEVFEIPALIPGPSNLIIDVYDWDGIGDDLIGSTSIDIEDRWFCQEWKNIKRKPIEWRTLRNPTSSMSQGKLEMWLDILPTSEAKKMPVVNIAPPPMIDFELRVIVWACKDVTIKDEVRFYAL